MRVQYQHITAGSEISYYYINLLLLLQCAAVLLARGDAADYLGELFPSFR